MTTTPHTTLIVDPPVDAMSSPDDVRAWIARLDQMAVEFPAGTDGARTIAGERSDAEELLAVVTATSEQP